MAKFRAGDITGAARVLASAHRAFPHAALLAQAHEYVQGQLSVLSGVWAPLPVSPARRADRLQNSGTVLHIVGTSLPYTTVGFTIRTQAIAQCQLEQGLHPEVVTGLGFPWTVGVTPTSPVETVDSVKYHRLGGPDTPHRWDDRLTASIEALRPIVDTVRPAVIHAHSDFRNGLLGLALRDEYSVPLVYEVRGFWEETWLAESPDRVPTSERYRWSRAREAEAMTGADLVVTLSDAMRRRIASEEVDPSRIAIVPNAVTPSRFPANLGRSRRLADSLDLPSDGFVVGYISSLRRLEGVDILIQAIAALRDAGRMVHCLIVGDGDASAELRKLVRTQGLSQQVTLVGEVPHDSIADYYALLDVFVVPRRDDEVCRLVTPLKPFEALSMGLPLVVSDLPPLTEIVDDSGGGMTFTAEDPVDLARTLARLQDDPPLRTELGRQGARWVRRHRTWSENGRRYRELYEGLGVA
jgi:glycosyltransferase involved in cell wall biosynthesis